MKPIFYTKNRDGIAMVLNGKQVVVDSTHANYEAIIKALHEKRYDEVEGLMSIKSAIVKSAGEFTKNPGSKITVEGDNIYFYDSRNRKKILINNTLVDRIIKNLKSPHTVKYANSLIALLENIQKNKIKDISEEFYEWAASGQAPITEDGCILAYKKVRSDFKDIYTGTMDNSPGKIVRMKQSDVDSNRNVECSRGLHFASLGYLSHYSSSTNSKVVIVKVNPRHIFAIPKDYNYQKGRASEYYVIGEYISGSRETEEAFHGTFVNEDNIQAVAPAVKFIDNPLGQISLEKRAELEGICKNGKVKIGYKVGYSTEDEALIWDNDQGCAFKVMSIETKRVRELVKQKLKSIEALTESDEESEKL